MGVWKLSPGAFDLRGVHSAVHRPSRPFGERYHLQGSCVGEWERKSGLTEWESTAIKTATATCMPTSGPRHSKSSSSSPTVGSQSPDTVANTWWLLRLPVSFTDFSSS